MGRGEITARLRSGVGQWNYVFAFECPLASRHIGTWQCQGAGRDMEQSHPSVPTPQSPFQQLSPPLPFLSSSGVTVLLLHLAWAPPPGGSCRYTPGNEAVQGSGWLAGGEA